MSNKQKELLKRMLGADSRYKQKQWGFRNHFFAGEFSSDGLELNKMEQEGLVISSERLGSIVFHATKKGAELIGFKPYQLRKAGII